MFINLQARFSNASNASKCCANEVSVVLGNKFVLHNLLLCRRVQFAWMISEKVKRLSSVLVDMASIKSE